MAKIEDLIDEIADPGLRERIALEVKDLKEAKRFGLVFEEHIPETVSLCGLPIRSGLIVQNRLTPKDLTEFQVLRVDGDETTLVPKGTDEPEKIVDVADLLVVKRFHEQVFPGLTPVGEVRRGADSKPAHVVINGENFHALQLLTYTYGGKVDCIYIDPPYNTGARDWKYNNRFVDENDSYRHSKWLSFMEKRLRLAQTLLRPDGVLIVTIDEHEVHHLGVLLEQVFPGSLRHLTTIVHNPKGTYKKNVARVEEYALFVCPAGEEVIGSLPEELFAQAASPEEMERIASNSSDTEDLYLRRRGQESGYRHQRPNQFYAILIDEENQEVVGLGPKLGPEDPWGVTRDDGIVSVYPIDTRGDERVWRYGRETMQTYVDAGAIVVTGKTTRSAQGWVLNHRVRREDTLKRVKSVWWEKRHDAGAHGSNLLNAYLGKSGTFPFPKSVYAVRDALAAIVANRPEALVLDFFAGSGTTLHSVALLNAADGGNRRCVLVTNNEVDDDVARRLNREGLYVGDARYEAEGIFEAVTRPRTEAVLTGLRPDGSPVEGDHVWAQRRPYSAGFPEHATFLRLDYLDPDLVELGRQFNAIAPMLWMTAGSVGEWEEWDGTAPWSLPEGSTYGVLFDEDHLLGFAEAVAARGSATHVWIVTNSHAAFAEMRQALPEALNEVRQLYRDYLRNFTINAPGVLRT